MKFYIRLCLLATLLGTLSACSGTDLLNAIIPTDGYRVVKDVTYAEHDRGKLDIYVPDQLAAGHPAVVFYYGGSWQEGSKDDYLFVGQALASEGIIAVIADYRLYPEIYFPVFMLDSAEAFSWAHAHIAEYGGNPQNLFLAGHSAGGYNAVMLSLNKSYLTSVGGSTRWISGTIGIAGAYDFLPMTSPNVIALFSKSADADTQPITFARAHAPPMLFLTGDEDDQVAPSNSYHLAKKLKIYGDNVTVKTYPGIGHIGIALALADGFRERAPVLRDTVDFIKAHTAGP